MHQNYSLLQEEKSSLTYYIEDSRKQLEEALKSQNLLQNTIDQQNQQILTLSQQLQQYETYTNDTNKNIEQLHVEIAQLKQDRDVGQKSLAECQQQLFAAMQELSDKTQSINDVTQELQFNQQQVETLEHELINVRQTLESTQREYTESLETLKKARFNDIETHFEEALAAKDLDIEKANVQLQECFEQNRLLAEKLDTETGMKMELEAAKKASEDKVIQFEEKLAEQLKLMEEEEKQLEEMRAIIEEQVVKIEELKTELFAKSNDYDSLVAEMDMGKKRLSDQQTIQSVSLRKCQIMMSSFLFFVTGGFCSVDIKTSRNPR